MQQKRLISCKTINSAQAKATTLKHHSNGYFMMKNSLILIFIFLSTINSQDKISSVHVIAPSVSTSIKAREILTAKNWKEVPLKRADYVLVVVRSVLYLPLISQYNSYCDLVKEAERQLNISGFYYHIYIYEIKDDFGVTEVSHKYFEAKY